MGDAASDFLPTGVFKLARKSSHLLTEFSRSIAELKLVRPISGAK
jgi:hypothetical protein